MRSLSLAAFVAGALVLASSLAQAGNQLPVAIGGYDSVSYHNGEPTRGEARFNHFWNGAVWYFASEENRNTFRKDPASYAPQFDGYCAWAASQGYKAPGDPQVYALHDGTLYLQVHPRAKELWEGDIPANIKSGEENWPRIHPF